MKYIFCFAILAGIFTGMHSVRGEGKVINVDSVGVEKVGGKIFVLHRVNQGQTMFAVVRQYGTTIHALREANPGMSDGIQSGQMIRVPYTPKAATKDAKKQEASVAAKPDLKEAKPVPSAPVAKPSAPATTPSAASAVSVASNGIHKVEPGQTLYRVAVKYGILMADIRKWNNLSDDNLKDGQELIVSERGGGKANAPTVTPSAPRVVTNVVKDSVRAKAVVAEKVVKPVEEVAPAKVIRGKSKSESGLAEGIETDESTSKFLGLHRTAPIGSLVQVLNEYNQESIIVRIIGRIPDTSANDDIIIKLSSRAFEKVSPSSKRFRAVVSYLE
jgi:LysM repeat protein